MDSENHGVREIPQSVGTRVRNRSVQYQVPSSSLLLFAAAFAIVDGLSHSQKYRRGVRQIWVYPTLARVSPSRDLCKLGCQLAEMNHTMANQVLLFIVSHKNCAIFVVIPKIAQK